MTNDPFTVKGTDAKDQFEPIEAGVHQAVLACIIHNPNQPAYQNVGTMNQCLFVWVTPLMTDTGGVPKQIRRTINMPSNPMHERANFRKMIESWIGSALTTEQVANFNMRLMLGARCTLVTTIETSKSDRRYAKLTSVGKAMKDAPKLPAGIVVHVTQVPHQQIISAKGVEVKVKAAGTETHKEEPPPLDEADMPF